MNRCPHCNGRLPRQMHFLPPSYGARPVMGVIAFTAVYGAAFFVAFHKLWPPDLWPWQMPGDIMHMAAGALLFGCGLALEGVLVTTLFWLLERDEGLQRVEATSPAFAAATRYTLRRLPNGVDQFRLWQYLVDVARGRVTLSQEGAAEHGFTQAQSNDIKDWLMAVGWWEWINQSNATGRWTGDGERVLEMLARPLPALWNEIIEPPTDSGAND